MSKRKKTTISYSSIINDDERKSINSNVVARVGGSSNFGGGSDDEEIIDDTNNGSNGRSKTDIVSNTDPNCVKFDVGGRIFKVRRSLLESFPETMLARSASDLWNTTTSAVSEAVSTSQDDTSKKKRAVKKNRVHHEQQQQQPIFIDRDSHRFSYVLDYMRDGCVVVLPVTISKESFLTELQYFGFDESIINQDLITCTVPTYDAVVKVHRLHKNFGSILHQMEIERDYRILAYSCFCDFFIDGSLTCTFYKNRKEINLERVESIMEPSEGTHLIPVSTNNLLVNIRFLASEFDKRQEQSSSNNGNTTISPNEPGTDGNSNGSTAASTTSPCTNITSHIDIFNTCLSEYGLRCTSIDNDSNEKELIIHLKRND